MMASSGQYKGTKYFDARPEHPQSQIACVLPLQPRPNDPRDRPHITVPLAFEGPLAQNGARQQVRWPRVPAVRPLKAAVLPFCPSS